MPAFTRGGVPFVRRVATSTDVQRVRLPFYAQHLKLRNKGASIVRVYFTQTAADAGSAGGEYIEVPVAAATAPHGEWEGPVETLAGSPPPFLGEGTAPGPQRVDAGSYVWVEAASGTPTLELVAFQRRG